MNDPKTQDHYQVRFDWGIEGAKRIAADAHVLIWADLLPEKSTFDPCDFAGPAVIAATTGSAAGIAKWVLDLQSTLGGRAIVAVVAAGGEDGAFAVEDMLVAGAAIDALSTAGLDSTSPEAAAASTVYEGLRRAVVHLTGASVAGQRWDPQARAVALAANAHPDVRVLREWSGTESR